MFFEIKVCYFAVVCKIFVIKRLNCAIFFVYRCYWLRMIGGISNTLKTYAKKAITPIWNKIPSIRVNDRVVYDKLGKIAAKISAPGENRLILGGTALLMQPIIDLTNKRVDEETRGISFCRTLGKIIAGTSVGFAVRKTCDTIVRRYTEPFLKNGAVNPNYGRFIVPRIADLKDLDRIRNYGIVSGTLLALGVMVGTNFLLDAPLTQFLTNKFKDWGLDSSVKNFLQKFKSKQVDDTTQKGGVK